MKKLKNKNKKKKKLVKPIDMDEEVLGIPVHLLVGVLANILVPGPEAQKLLADSAFRMGKSVNVKKKNKRRKRKED